MHGVKSTQTLETKEVPQTVPDINNSAREEIYSEFAASRLNTTYAHAIQH